MRKTGLETEVKSVTTRWKKLIDYLKAEEGASSKRLKGRAIAQKN